MDFQIWRDLFGEPGHAHVLHDDRVDSAVRNRRHGTRRFAQFMIEDEGVEGEVAADAAPVQGRASRRAIRQGESDLGSRREVLQAKVDGVGAGLDGGAKLRPVAGGRHDFGFDQRDTHHTDSKSDSNCFFTLSLVLQVDQR